MDGELFDRIARGQPLALRARYIFPVSRPPLVKAMLTICGERIMGVGENASNRPEFDLGDVAIVPSFVNAHTHLEFSGLGAPLGVAGEPLTAWIRRVLAYRRESSPGPAEGIHRGLRESAAAGVTLIGEIATCDLAAWGMRSKREGEAPDASVVGVSTGAASLAGSSAAANPCQQSPLPDVTIFRELIGLNSERVAESLISAKKHLMAGHHAGLPSAGARAADLSLGLSPHAPYSVHTDLLSGAASLAVRHRAPVAMHIAESREELELLRSGSGPFRELLEELGVWNPAAFRAGDKPLNYLRRLARAPRILVVHGNYLDREEIEFVASNVGRMTVVYCPRTHAFFGHDRYPLMEFLAAGAAVAIGTDSRASNPDLSVLAELRSIVRAFPKISLQQVLQLGTLAGARAFGRDVDLGSIEPGKLANLAIVPVSSATVRDPHEALFNNDRAVSACWLRGVPVTASIG